MTPDEIKRALASRDMTFEVFPGHMGMQVWFSRTLFDIRTRV